MVRIDTDKEIFLVWLVVQKVLLKFGPQCWGGDYSVGAGIRGLGFPAFSRSTTQYCMFNSPAPGEPLENQATFPKYLILRPHISRVSGGHGRRRCGSRNCGLRYGDGWVVSRPFSGILSGLMVPGEDVAGRNRSC